MLPVKSKIILIIKNAVIFLYGLWGSILIITIRLAELLKIVEFYQPISDLGLGSKVPRKRITNRLEAIHEYLPEGKLSGIDIGCNIGFYCFELAKQGHFMLGIEPYMPVYFSAKCVRQKLGMKNVLFSDMRLTPNNISLLPKFDFTILMSVFHHWCVHYGTEGGLIMLATVLKNTEKVLFFETGEPHKNSKRYGKCLPDMGGNPEKWMHEYFLNKGCSEVKTISSKGRSLIAAYK